MHRLIERLSRRIGAPQIFADFVELSSIALGNAVDRTRFASPEARYCQIRKDHPANGFEQFSTMLGLLTLAMEAPGFEDILGGLCMGLGLGDRRRGQFFTPYSISQVMATVVIEAIPSSGASDAWELAGGSGHRSAYAAGRPTGHAGALGIRSSGAVRLSEVRTAVVVNPLDGLHDHPSRPDPQRCPR